MMEVIWDELIEESWLPDDDVSYKASTGLILAALFVG